VGAEIAVDDDFARIAGPFGFDVIGLRMALEIHVYADEIGQFISKHERDGARLLYNEQADGHLNPVWEGILHGEPVRIQLATQTNDGLLKV
jgi:hypothetical protein